MAKKKTTGKTKLSDEEKILKLMRKRFKLCEERYAKEYKEAQDDLKYLTGEQWDSATKAERDSEGKPTFTCNQLPQYVHKVSNDIREVSPAIKILADDEDATQETANYFRGKIRKIEQRSSADIAYDTGVFNAIAGAYGYFRVNTKYKSDRSFDQDITIDPIQNSFSVMLDAMHKEPDGSDSKYGFIYDEMLKDEFKDRYPENKLQSIDDKKSDGWFSKDTVRIAEYFFIEEDMKDICLMSDGSVLDKEEADQAVELGALEKIRSRKAKVKTVRWIKTNGHEILEETIWPGKWIPIIKVIGWEVYIDGKPKVFSMIRFAKDPQRLYNYLKSLHLELLAIQPKASWVATMKQIKGHEHIYETANRKNYPVMPYNMDIDAKTGQAAPPPQRSAPPQMSQGIMLEAQSAQDDMKASIGMFENSLGMQSNEIAGVAIEKRQISGDKSNFHFIDNLARSITHTGRILVDLIPKVYPGEREEKILLDDGSEETVPVNRPYDDKDKETGEKVKKLIDPNKGSYDVVVDVGKSYATKRQAALENLMNLATQIPEVMGVAGDLIAKNMDWEGAEEISERFKHLLPPELKGEDRAAMIQQQAQEMQQMLEGQIMQLHEKLQDKTVSEQNKLFIEQEKIKLEHLKIQLDAEAVKAEAFKDYAQGINELHNEILDRDQAIVMLMEHIESGEMEEPEMSNPPAQEKDAYNATTSNGGNDSRV